MARMVAEAAPASSPKMVTLLGSPPNFSMFCCTHLSTMIWSWMPKFPVEKLSPVARKPRGPRR